MPYQTLAERYESRAKDIYNRFAPSEDQLVVIKPASTGNPLAFGVLGSRSRVKNDTRAVPTVSVLRDAVRIGEFLKSLPSGPLFLGKQALLQTGNTFENTKLLNPLSFLGNTAPFFHFKRHVNFPPAVTSGILQENTLTSITSNFNGTASTKLIDKLKDRVRGTFAPYRAIFSPTSVTDWKNARPEIRAFSTNITNTLGTLTFATVNSTLLSPKLYAPQAITERGKVQVQREVVTKPSPTLEGGDLFSIALNRKTNFYNDTQNKGTNRFYSSFLQDASGYDEPDVISFAVSGQTKLQDPYNIPTTTSAARAVATATGNTPDAILEQRTITGADTNRQIVNYRDITKSQPNKSDIIKFTFKNVNNLINPNAAPVHFRAFISALKENIKTEFNEQRYIGRTERFVTYGGAKRGVDLRFNIVAFSRAEIDTMWTRINYLSGMAFPQDTLNGFMIPPLFAFTIGGLYDNQRGYVESLDYDFIDETTTFDIDKEVPFHIAVSMKISLLESRSKYYDSPFYKITQSTLTR
jgi:hypothetical protein